MKVRTYRAINMQEAIRQIKEDLGPQAVILSTRKVVEGKRAFGLLGRPLVEVTAARNGSGSNRGVAEEARARPGSTSRDQGLDTVLQEIRDLKREFSGLIRASRAHSQRIHNDTAGGVKELKWWANYMFKKWGKNGVLTGSARETEAFLRLVDMGVKESLAVSLVERLGNKKGLKELGKDDYEEMLVNLLARLTKVKNPLEHRSEGPKLLALVGPAGVGKTTTCAKLAARCALGEGKSVALVTNDTYRIAAMEQLRTYARIMGIPLEVVLDSEELGDVIERLSDRDVILMDISGKSPLFEGQIEEIEGFVARDERIETLLLLSATTGVKDLERLMAAFGELRPSGLIVTKLDEAREFGRLFSASLMHKLPFTFFGVGQRVPEDILEATKEDAAGWTFWGIPAFYDGEEDQN